MPRTRPSAPLMLICLLLASSAALGQPPGFAIPAGVPPEIRAKMEEARRRASRSSSSEPKKDEQKKKDDEEKKEDKEEDKKDEDDKEKDEAVKRPNEPPRPPDPRELEAKPDANGRVSFSFHGQAWADVLQWLANVSGMSLDWRELPGDYLNLTTQRSYTLAEARDLINRHLQARGYTLLLSGEVLSVFKLDDLDPSLAPRVEEEDLYDRQPHDVVKLSLELPPGLEVKQAVEDVKQALSKHAKVMPLAATNRVLMIDTVANLRMVSALLNSERLAAEGRVVPREFVLQYVQASSVIDTLYVVLGLDPNSRPSQMELRMQQKKLELMQQLAQRGKDVAQMLQKDGPPVYLAYNRQRNSVLANAPPEQMRIIARTIDALDVPAGGVEGSIADTSERKLEQYRLKTISPDAVITTLEEIGNLSPRAELRGDSASKTLFARASTGDHEKIVELIDQLDGSETVVEVFQLRRLPAEAVAGSIESLIIQKPEEDNNDDFPFFFRRRNQEPKEPKTLLRVDADVERNRLIVRGTPQQLEEVRDLLVKLGEPIGGASGGRRVRVLEAMDPAETRKLLERLQQAWPSIGGETELIIPPADEEEEPEDAQPEEDEPRKITASDARSDSPFRLLANREQSDDAEASESKPDQQPPVTVQLDPQGRIVLSSNDTEALDRLEELAAELAPPAERYHVFQVENRSPELLVANLEVYFQDFMGDDGDPIVDWWGRIRNTQKKDDEPVRLSRRRPLRFLADDWSSSILVANATTAQLTEIDRLIEAWDKLPVSDRIITRRTATVKLRFVKASVVVDALKNVYRDLLSKGDREFDTEERKASGISTRYLTRLQHGSYDATEPAGIAFDGLLSLGADDEANVVIVSAREEVFNSVLDTIEDLDQQAQPNTAVRVVSLEGAMATEQLRDALSRALQTEGSANNAGQRGGRNDRGRGWDRGGRGRGRGRGWGR